VKKQIIQVTLAILFTLTIMGVASASGQQVIGTSQDPQQIGTTVAQNAMNSTSLGMNSSDGNLLITTASTARQNGQTTENSTQAVVDTTNTLSRYSQKITYGQGNLLIINDPNGPLEFTFISKTGNTLMAKKYSVSQTGVITTTKDAFNIGTAQSQEQFQAAIAALGDNGFNIAAIANLWAAGAPADLLATTYTTGIINQRSMINYAIAKQFQQNYPDASVGSNSWRGVISNYIFSSPGNTGIDTAIYGVHGFSYYYYIMNSIPSNKIGIMQYNKNTTSGLIAVIHMNDLRSTYGTVTSGTLSEIMFNNWLFNNYLKNSANLHYLYSVDMLKQVNEAAFKYLWFDSALGYGHGLDINYISNLPDPGGSFDQSQSVVPVTSIQQMRQLGEEAFNHAWNGLGYSSADDFINGIRSGVVGVIGLPYYSNVMYNGQLTSLAGFLDGINSANIFTVHNMMTVNSHVEYNWDKLQALFLRVTSVDLTNSSNTKITQNTITFINGTFVATPAGSLASWGGVRGMILAWAQQAPYEFMRTLSFAGCRGSSLDYTSAVWGIERYPLKPNEYYKVITFRGIQPGGFCQMDPARAFTTTSGVSLSKGTYLTSGSTINPNALYILNLLHNSYIHP